MAWESHVTGDGKRLLLAHLIAEHRLGTRDPLAPPNGAWEDNAALALLSDAKVAPDQAAALVEDNA